MNPRLQVEHTITEAISMTDIVKVQLLLAQGADLDTCGLIAGQKDPETPPPAYSVQLRITAEDVHKDWSLSIGRISSFQFPTGNGVRVDTHLINGQPAIVSADFDSLIAKIIVTASSWVDVVRKAQRALKDTRIHGVKTNLAILRGIVAHPDFLKGKCDTQWLESKQQELLVRGEEITASSPSPMKQENQNILSVPTNSAGTTLFRKGDAWSVTLGPRNIPTEQRRPHHLEISRVLRNEFPKSFSADIILTEPSTSSTPQQQPVPLTLTFNSTSASASATTSHHRHGNPSDSSHIVIPFPGKLVEVLVDEEDILKEGDVICVVQQMKMELEVRSPRNGKVTWLMEIEDGEEVEDGMLAAIVETEEKARL